MVSHDTEWLVILIIAKDLDKFVTSNHDSPICEFICLSETLASLLTKANELVGYFNFGLEQWGYWTTFYHFDFNWVLFVDFTDASLWATPKGESRLLVKIRIFLLKMLFRGL